MQEINMMVPNQLADRYRLLSLRRSKYEEESGEWNECGTEEVTAYSSTKRKKATKTASPSFPISILPSRAIHHTYSNA